MAKKMNCNGVLVVNKPVGPTSHDIVYRCRRLTGPGIKVGHTGTLDPFASGVLVVVTGQATRLASYLQASQKEYLAEIRLGRETDTHDREGRTVAEGQVPVLDDNEIEALLDRFRGPIRQVPPMYSAIKINGERLYKAARRNETVERPPREVEIFSLELRERAPDRLGLEIRCSSGTYIRSLARDLGRTIGCGAHLASLVRTRSGDFTLDEARTLEEIAEDTAGSLVPMNALLTEMPCVELDDSEADLILNGQALARPAPAEGREFRVLHRGDLLALAIRDGECIRPKLVLKPSGENGPVRK